MKLLKSLFLIVFSVMAVISIAQSQEKSAATSYNGKINIGPYGDFVGSEACKECHTEVHGSWQHSLMSQIVQPADVGLLSAVVKKWNDGGPTVGNQDNKSYKLEDVVLVVGSNWKQRFLVPSPQAGSYQFLDKQFNRLTEKWEGYGQKNSWDFMCATCHSTGYTLEKYEEKDGKVNMEARFVEFGVGCEACHGAGAAHLKSTEAKDIYNPGKVSAEESSMLCGYCHIRGDHTKFKSSTGGIREDMPHFTLGKTYKPGEDWTKWDPASYIVPGVQPEDKLNAEYTGNLKGAFIVDNISNASGIYDAAKHHEQYQEWLQSKHANPSKGKAVVGCVDCHAPHSDDPTVDSRVIQLLPQERCDTPTCHGAKDMQKYDYKAVMPGLGSTASGLFMRSHTFLKDQPRASKPTIDQTGPINYENPEKRK